MPSISALHELLCRPLVASMKAACVFSLDDNYVIPFKVFYSTLETTDSIPASTPIYILHTSSLSASSIKAIQVFLAGYQRTASFVDASQEIPKVLPIQSYDHVSPATFYRLFIAEILDPDITHAVYLDADMLAIRSIAPLFTMPVNGLVAASDHCRPHDGIRLWGACGGDYFQAGVLVIPLSRWIENECTKMFTDILANDFSRIQLWDQDVLNIAFKDNWERIPVTYNANRDVRSSFSSEYCDVPFEPRLIHFDGPGKPWNRSGNDLYSTLWHKAHYAVFNEHHPRSLGLLEAFRLGLVGKAGPLIHFLDRIYRRILRELT